MAGKDVSLLGALQDAVEKVLARSADIGPIEILRAVAAGLETGSYPACAGAVTALVGDLTGIEHGGPPS